MEITVIAVGRLKESAEKALCAEYIKRLTRFCRIEIVEIADEDCGAGEKRAVSRESAAVLAKIPPQALVILCDIQGKMFTSEEFAAELDRRITMGSSRAVFIIGGSCGVSDEVRDRADMRLSFSRLTFPHRLFRVMLLEQIYRAFKIINNETYHK